MNFHGGSGQHYEDVDVYDFNHDATNEFNATNTLVL